MDGDLASVRSGGAPGAEPAAGTAPADARPAGASRRLVDRVRGSRLVRRAAAGAFWSVFGQVASRVLTLFGSILVARQLGATRFGEYSLVLVTVGMFQNVAGFGLVTTSTKFLAGKYRADPEAAGRVVALSRLVASATGWIGLAAVLLSAPWLAREVLGAPQLQTVLRIGALLLLFGPIYGAQLGVLTGLERFRLLAGVSSLAALAAIPLLVGGAVLAGTVGCVVGLVASVALSNVLHAVAVGRALRAAGIAARYRGAFREWRILVSYSLPTTLSNVLLGVTAWGTSAILAHEPAGLREIGLFSAANQWRNGIVLVTTAAGAALLPLFSDLHDNAERGTLTRAFWTSFVLSAATCVAVAAGVSLASPAIMSAYGPEFAGAAAVLVLLAVTGALAAPLTIASHAIAGAGRMWLSFGLKIAWAATLLALAYALRARGAVGVSIAHVSAFALHLLLSVAAVALLLRRRDAEARAPRGGGG